MASPVFSPTAPSSSLARAGIRLVLGGLLAWHLILTLWMAWAHGPGDYFYDERFNMENVRAIVGSGRLQPANAWYGPMTYLPQTAVIAGLERFHRASGGRGWEMLDQNGGATVAAYRVARLVGIAYGVTAVLVLFWAGQALGGAGAGLAAAVVLASSPWAIRSAVEFKPDGPLLLALALCLRALVAACQRPSVGRLIGVAALFGAATAVKLNAAFFAPLLLFPAWALARTTRLRRVAAGLAASAVVAPLTFLLLTPWFEEWLFFFGRIQKHYHRNAVETGVGTLAAEMGRQLLSPVYLGRWVGLCALLGGLWALWRARRAAGRDLAQLAVVVAIPLYLSLLLAATRYPKSNNLVPLLPFAAVLAGLFAARLAQVVTERLGRWPAMAPLLAAGLLAVTAMPAAWSFSVEEHVPTTLDLALLTVKSRLPFVSPRVGLYCGLDEAPPGPLVTSGYERRFVSWWPADGEAAGMDPRLADLLLAPPGACQERESAFCRALSEPAGSERIVFAPGLLRARGPELSLRLQPWQPYGDEVELPFLPEEAGRWRLQLPEEWPEGELVSLQLELPDGVQPTLRRADGTSIPIGPAADWRGAEALVVTTARFHLAAGEEIALAAPPESSFAAPGEERARVLASRWRSPAETDTVDASGY